MRSISGVADHQLTWTQKSGFKNEYDLQFGGELVGTLRFPKMLSSAAIAESADGSWTFTREGFWKPRTIMRVTGSEEVLGTYAGKAFGSGGTLTLPDGRSMTISVNVWGREMKFRDGTGETLVETKSHGFFRQTVDVQINRKASHLPELPWLVMLIQYIAIMMRREAAAHSAAH